MSNESESTSPKVKALTLENLNADAACAQCIRYWRKNDAPERPDREWLVKIINEQPDYWNWCSIHGYADFTALPEGLSVGGSLYLSGTQIKTKDVPAKLKSKVIR